MGEFIKIAASVTAPLSFLGLVVALGYLVYIQRLKHKEKQLENLPANTRARLVDEYLTRYGIDGKDLRPHARLALIRAELEQRHRRSLEYVRYATVAFVICFGIAAVSYLVHGSTPEDPNAFLDADGTINTPKDDETVKRQFVASGTVQNVRKGVYLWLAVETDGLIWPKEHHLTKIDANGNWSQVVSQDSNNTKQFDLKLFATNNEADVQLRAWLNEAIRTGNYPGMRRLDGMKELRRVSGLRLRSDP